MKNKYYNPTIEEFHVGFRFEHKPRLTKGMMSFIEESDEYGPKYNKATFRGGVDFEKVWTAHYSTPYTLSDVESYLVDKAIRVKYLNKEDLEELGFKIHRHKEEYVHAKNEKLNYIIKYGLKNHQLMLSVYSVDTTNLLNTNNPITYNLMVFRGVVKNYNELKRILQQAESFKLDQKRII